MAKRLDNSGVLFTERRDFYLKPQTVAELYPNAAPYYSTLLEKPAERTKDPDFKMFEHRSGFIKQQFQANDASIAWSGAADGDVGQTATLDAIDGIFGLSSSADSTYKGLVCEVYDVSYLTNAKTATYKGMVIVANVSGSAVTVKSLGNPRATDNKCSALADNDVFVVVSNAFGEGTYAPDAFADELSFVYNSTQIFKTPVEVTGTLLETALKGYSNELARLREEKGKEHKVQMNQQLLFGVRPYGIGSLDLAGHSNSDSFANHITDADGKLVRMTMGMIPAVYKYGTSSGDKKNIFNITASNYLWDNFVDDCEKVFQYVPSKGVKRAVAGMQAISFWNKMSGGEGFMRDAQLNVTISEWKTNRLGINIRILETPHGIIELMYDPAMKGAYSGSMLVYDDDYITRKIFRNPRYQTNIKTDNAYDGVKDQYFADEGQSIQLIEAHSIWNIV